MPSPDETKLYFRLYPSKWLMGSLLLLHAIGLFLLLHLPLQWWAKALIALVVFASLWHAIVKHVSRHRPRSVQAFSVNDKLWQVHLRNEKIIDAQLLADSVVTQWLVILHLRSHQGKRINIVLFKDAIASHQWRLLQRQLRGG